MFCENCGTVLKETDKFCTKCGWKNPDAEKKQDNAAATEETAVKAEGAAETGGNAAKTEEAAEQQTAPNAMSTAETARTMPDMAGNTAGTEGGKTKKLPPKAPLFIAAAVAVLVLIILAVNHAALGNFMRKTFYSPEEYYQYVEKGQLEEYAASAAAIYNNRVKQSINVNDMSISGEIELELGEEGQDLISLAGLAGFDLSWLDTVKLVINTSNKQNLWSNEMEAYLSGDKLISVNSIVDVEGETAYFQIPELTDKYLGMELHKMNPYYGTFYGMYSYDMMLPGEAEEDVTAMMEELRDKLPDRKTVEKLLNRYGKLALECIDDVDINKDVILKAEGVSQKCTKLTATIDDDTLSDIIEAVLEQAKEDEDLEKLICSIADLDEYLDPEEVYKEFQEELDESLRYISVDTDMKIKMIVWLDGKGEVRGRSIEIDDGDDKVTVEARMPQKGKNFGYRLLANADGTNVSLEGTGKRSGDKISGDFQFKYNGAGIMDIEVDGYNTKKVREGYINGSFNVQPSSQLMSLISMADFTSVTSRMGKVSLGIDLESDKNKFGLGLQAIYDDEDLGTLHVDIETGKGKKASIPKQKNVIMAEDEEDAMDWYETIDWDKFISKLEKTELPSEIIDYLEDALDMMDYYY